MVSSASITAALLGTARLPCPSPVTRATDLVVRRDGNPGRVRSSAATRGHVMNESVLLTLQAVVWARRRACVHRHPVRWSEPFAFQLDRSGVFFARLAEASSVGFAGLDWLARDQDPATLGRSSPATSSRTPSAPWFTSRCDEWAAQRPRLGAGRANRGAHGRLDRRPRAVIAGEAPPSSVRRIVTEDRAAGGPT